ncbi:hypothetical protein [Halomarina oriensis]|uniref:Uncharacterized protein n=1 Tax=Halomarina oriensis TaxID=671145 RepID=A0A6B0GSA8_9EURY|nr:hypothetical protein [Halomarina oriensis]MWG36197.1 hypothetical protein [Halomarina oriensis]
MSAQTSLDTFGATDRNPTGQVEWSERSVCSEAATWLQMHADIALALPRPGLQWEARELDGVGSSIGPALGRLRRLGIIERCHTTTKNDVRRTVWSTSGGAYAWIQNHVEIGDRLPCGHRGLRNIPAGDYTCTNDDCEREFSRWVAHEVFCE